MSTYVLLTRLSTEAIKDPKELVQLSERVTQRIEAECPNVSWIASYSVLGPYDYVDIFEAPDNEAATRVAVIIRSFGHATTETWPATPWERFKSIAQSMHG
jgi:uncharacterized protein with GYD domain